MKSTFIRQKMIENIAGKFFLLFIFVAEARAMTFSENDNFNSGTAGSAPSGWSLNTTGGTIAVQNVPSVANKSVEIIKTATPNNAGGTKTFAAVSGIVTIEARVKTDETANYKSAPYIGSAVDVAFNAGNIQAYVGTTLTTLMPFAAGTWYNLRIRLNTVTQTYDLYVDGLELVYQGAFRSATSSITSVNFNIGTGYTGTLYYDNVLVYTDTPSTTPYLAEENFEDDPVGSAPAGWSVGLVSGSSIEVSPFPNAYNNCLEVAKTASSGSVVAAKSFGATTGKVVIQANILAKETTGYKNAFYLTDSAGNAALSIAFDSGNIKSYVGSTLTTLQPFVADSWYTVKAVVDTASQTYDLYVDGCKLLSNAAFRVSTSNVSLVQFAIGSGFTGTLCVDNMLVYAFNATKPGPIYDVAAYGAVGDGVTLNTTAIQNAINACAGTGGTVYLHDGTFLTGELKLGSNMTFYIENTATLLGSQEDADYPTISYTTPNINKSALARALLYAVGSANLKIDGGGTLDGNGDLDEWLAPANLGEYYRPVPVLLIQCTNVSVRNIYITQGAMWTLVPLECTNVTLSDIDVNSNLDENRDGMDICDSNNVVIERCNIFSDDDSICFKSGIAAGVDNVTVRYCNVGKSERANGIKFGTASYGAFTNMIFEDVYVKDCDKAGIAIEAVDGANIYNITFRRITLNDVGSPFYAIIGTRCTTPSGSPVKMGSIDGLRYEAISGGNMKYTTGSPISGTVASGVTYTIYSLLFSNVDVDYAGGLTSIPADPPEMGTEYPECDDWGNLPAYGYYVRHVNGISFIDSTTTVSPTDVRLWRKEVDVANDSTR